MPGIKGSLRQEIPPIKYRLTLLFLLLTVFPLSLRGEEEPAFSSSPDQSQGVERRLSGALRRQVESSRRQLKEMKKAPSPLPPGEAGNIPAQAFSERRKREMLKRLSSLNARHMPRPQAQRNFAELYSAAYAANLLDESSILRLKADALAVLDEKSIDAVRVGQVIKDCHSVMLQKKVAPAAAAPLCRALESLLR